jgi:plasmid stability protein
MAQLVVRNIEAGTKLRLQRRAKRHGRSLEEEVRVILRDAAKDDVPPVCGLGTQIASLFRKGGLAADIPEFHGIEIKPPSID